jgi:hypothetical protein
MEPTARLFTQQCEGQIVGVLAIRIPEALTRRTGLT